MFALLALFCFCSLHIGYVIRLLPARSLQYSEVKSYLGERENAIRASASYFALLSFD